MPPHEVDYFHNICIDMPNCRPRLHAIMIHNAFDPLEEFEHATRGRPIRALSAGMHDLSTALCQAVSRATDFHPLGP